VQGKGYESHSREDRVTVGFRVTTKVGYGWLNISSRTREDFTLTRYDHHPIGFISWPQFK